MKNSTQIFTDIAIPEAKGKNENLFRLIKMIIKYLRSYQH